MDRNKTWIGIKSLLHVSAAEVEIFLSQCTRKNNFEKITFKGVIGCKIHFYYVVWTEMCLGSVCTQPHYNDNNPPGVFIFIKSNKL